LEAHPVVKEKRECDAPNFCEKNLPALHLTAKEGKAVGAEERQSCFALYYASFLYFFLLPESNAFVRQLPRPIMSYIPIS